MTRSAPAAIPRTDVSTIPDQVKRLRTAFDSGRTRPEAWRREQLQQLKRLLTTHGQELVDAIHADLGRPEIEGWITDVTVTVAEVDLAAKKLSRWMKPERVSTPLNQQPATARIVREPLGVVLIIAPWNYPVQLMLSPLVGAIAAGNCAVLKPSEVSAHTSAALGRLLPRYLDPECFAVIEGGVDETTALLRERFDHILYTGNGHVAKVVMEAAAKHLTPVTLELGGKSPCIVDSEVDLAVAARRIVWGKFLNAGQTCIAPDYVLVHESREKDLLDAMKATLREFYGEDPQRTPDFGRVINERHLERLAGLLGSGEVVVGGQVDEVDCYLAPTILRSVSPDSPVMRDEIFGPILPVLTVPDIDSAISFVNARPKPLALYVFTKRRETEEAVISRTTSGGACVNATIWHIANPGLPFGGVGPSGMGAYHGRDSFECFSHRRAVVSKSTAIDPKIAYPPYTKWKTTLIRKLL
ncbi:aldehyde dehydrogenase (NAD+) [Myxococcaceae bacterium]|jgi:aldehyde dehydrogenase (NAD+)|nr:aldehyde dehydrogenase (NAD+) [Myxococcaceae bacterium]